MGPLRISRRRMLASSAAAKETVGALRSNGAYPALGDRVRVGCSDGVAHTARTLALPHRVEGRTELVVEVT